MSDLLSTEFMAKQRVHDVEEEALRLRRARAIRRRRRKERDRSVRAKRRVGKQEKAQHIFRHRSR